VTPSASEVSRELDALALAGNAAQFIAHELNNILTPVRCYAELALAKPSSVELTQQALQLARDGAERASRLVYALLDDARAQQIDATAPCRVEDAVKHAIRFVPSLNAASSGLVIQSSVGNTPEVAMNKQHLEQVVLNLLLNAKSAIGHTPGLITITSKCSTGNTHAAELSVRDSGRGIAPAQVKHINDLLAGRTAQLQRSDGSACTAKRAFGLEICGRLVRAVGGALHIASIPNKGTCCTIELPLARPFSNHQASTQNTNNENVAA